MCCTDLHGNYEDLVYLGQRMWPCGVKNTPGQFLFLGDYVDRGPNSPEVVAFLLAHKLLYGKRWHLVRGNHETRACNQGSGAQGFLGQCVELFGKEEGMHLWEVFNQCFDMMPVAALINGRYASLTFSISSPSLLDVQVPCNYTFVIIC